MKRKTLIRLFSALLIAIMALSFFVACGNETVDPGKEKPQGGDDPINVNDPENPNIPAKDYGGKEFSIICQPYLDSNAYTVNFMVSEGETGENVLLDAVYRRNVLLEEKYNIKITQIQTTDLLSNVRKQVLGGSTEFDIIYGNCERLSTLAREKALLDLNTIDRFDMTKSYWDANAAKELLIGDKLYFTNCDFNAQEVAFVVYFNKKLVEDFSLTSPYELMKNNEWTVDNWAKMVEAVHKDLNDLGDENNIYGTLSETHNPRMFLYGFGIRATTNDATGYPEVTLMADADKTVKAYEKLKAVFSNKEVSWDITGMPSDSHGYPDRWDYMRSLFCQDLYLFHYEGTNIIHQFRDMEHEFGVLPFPKYDQNQTKYYSMYPYYCSLVALPSTLAGDELERVTTIFEDMNFYSKILLKPAWFDTLLSRKYTRDDESESNLQTILEGRVYDIGLYYDFGGIRSKVLDVDCTSANITNNFARITKAVNNDIKKIYRDYGINS